MKTRKIVSVAMAGLMATSALAACKQNGVGGTKEFSSFFCTPATVETIMRSRALSLRRSALAVRRHGSQVRMQVRLSVY